MKKIGIILALLALAGSVALAQDAKPEGKHHGKKDCSAVEAAQKRTDFMADRYGLSDQQKTDLFELNLKQAEKKAHCKKGQKPEFDPQNAPKPDGQFPKDAPKDGQRPPQGGPQGGQGFHHGGPHPGGPGMGPRPMQPTDNEKAELKAEQKAYKKAVKKIFTRDQFKQFKKDLKAQEKHRK